MFQEFGEDGMRFYRVYEIDEADRIEDTRFIEAADDVAALEQAREAAGVGAAIEVWDQRRLVGRLVSRTQSMAPMALVAADQLIRGLKTA